MKRPASTSASTASGKRSKTSKRPQRVSAGKSTLAPGFIATEDAIKQLDVDDSELSDDSLDRDGQRKRLTARKRPKSPEPPSLPPLPNDEPFDEGDELPKSSSSNLPQEVSLSFNVPPNHTGPFVVKLDLKNLTTNEVQKNITSLNATTRHSSLLKDSKREGFLSLPAELRNNVYRLVFVAKDALRFDNPYNWCRSSAFLRTCRQVNFEGTQILYGENRFVLTRENRVRGAPWTPTWEVVGWKDIRRFLTNMGPINISSLRFITVIFDDAPGTKQFVDEQRYVHDEHLIECLKLLATHGQLQKLNLVFHGRKKLKTSDVRFLNYLKQIKADKLRFNDHPSWGSDYPHNAYHAVVCTLREAMERKKKLYHEVKCMSPDSETSASEKSEIDSDED